MPVGRLTGWGVSFRELRDVQNRDSLQRENSAAGWGRWICLGTPLSLPRALLTRKEAAAIGPVLAVRLDASLRRAQPVCLASPLPHK